MKSLTRFTFFVALMGLMMTLITGYARPVEAASAGDVLIIEVNSDPAITEPAAEFFEIYNNTAAPIDLLNWTATDNGVTTITFPSIILNPGKILVVIADAAQLGAGGYNCATVPLSHQPATWFAGNLANGNDRLLIRDNASNLIDAVSYGTDVTAFNPAAPDVFNNTGQSLVRAGYNLGPFTDTDTAADWSGRAGGTPCDVTPTAVTLSQTGANTAAFPTAALTAVFAALVVASLVIGRRQQEA